MTEDNQGHNGTGDQNNNNQNNQDAQPKWISQLPENLRGNEKLTKYKTIGELGNAFIDLDGQYTKMEGAIHIPGNDATDEDRATFFKKLGRPDKPEDYKFADIQWPDGVDEHVKTAAVEDIEAFRPVMHELGISQDVAQKLIDKYLYFGIERLKKADLAAIQNQEKIKDDLQKEWGGKYKENMELSIRGVEKAGELAGIKDEFKKFMDASQLGDDPMFIKVFHAIGKAIADDSALETNNNVGDPRLDKTGMFRLNFPSMKGAKK